MRIAAFLAALLVAGQALAASIPLSSLPARGTPQATDQLPILPQGSSQLQSVLFSQLQTSLGTYIAGLNYVTAASTLGTHGVVVSEGGRAVSATAAGASGYILTGNGAGADPTFQAGYLINGAGAPGTGSEPIGTLYVNTVTSQLYHYQTPVTGAAVVQYGDAFGDNPTVNLGSSPATGDYLIAMEWTAGGGCGAANAGWTAVQANSSGGGQTAANACLAYRIAGGGASNSQQPYAANTGAPYNAFVVIWEVSGLPSTWTAAVQSVNYVASGSPVTFSTVGSAGNTLTLVGAGNGASSACAPTQTGGNIATNFTGLSATDISVGFVYGTLAQIGGTATVTMSFSCNPNTPGGYILLLNNGAGFAASPWAPISRLSAVENNGAAVTSIPQSLNFTTPCTASSDAYGNVTASCGPLSGSTGSLGGSSVAAGVCVSASATITGAAVGMAADANPATYPGDGFDWRPYVSAANAVVVKLCNATSGALTPTASIYNVRVNP